MIVLFPTLTRETFPTVVRRKRMVSPSVRCKGGLFLMSRRQALFDFARNIFCRGFAPSLLQQRMLSVWKVYKHEMLLCRNKRSTSRA